MTAKTKVAATAAVMLAVAGAVVWWQMDPGAPGGAISGTATNTAKTASGSIDEPPAPHRGRGPAGRRAGR